MLVGGLSARELEADRAALTALPHGAELLERASHHRATRLRVIARASTWGILALEAASRAYVVASDRLIAMLEHAALLMFCGVTYAFAPVAGSAGCCW